jgi:anhydro-N-acetylmuramic acid kinase
LNLGGISNISFESKGKRIAYDIGLANMILNYITGKIKLSFDDTGQLARKGTLNQQMYDELNALEYYKLPFPKSTGYEWFLEKVVPIVEITKDSIENLLHTSVHHLCEQISIQVKEHIYKEENIIFVTGGGALNDFLMETLQNKLKNRANIVQSNQKLIEYKEALVFGLMGVLRIENKTNVLSSVTGAKSDSSSGVIFFPN